MKIKTEDLHYSFNDSDDGEYLHCNWRHDDTGKLVAYWYAACKLPKYTHWS